MAESSGADHERHIRNLILKSGMPLKTFSEAIGISSKDALEWWSGHGTELSDKNVESLGLFLGVPEDQIIKSASSHDIALIRRRLFDGPRTLPDKYEIKASSYVRTSAHIVDYLALVYGRRVADKFLSNLGIHPLYFDEVDNKINFLFYIDAFNCLSRMGMSDDEVASLASYIFLRVQNTEIGQKFMKAKTYEESYNVLAFNALAFESNFEYLFEITSRQIRITAKPAEASVFIDNLSTGDLVRLFKYRKNIFGWFPILSNLAPLNLKLKSCLMMGDKLTVYEGQFPGKASRMHLSLLSEN